LTSRCAAWLAVPVLVLGLACCGGGKQNEPQEKVQPGPPQQRHGQLSVAEYRVILSEYRRLTPLRNGRDDPGALARGRRACGDLRKPATALIARVRADCDNAMDFFGALRDVDQAAGACTTGSQRDRIGCVHDRYVRMADAIRTTDQGGVALNNELRRRGITGLCARSIGITQSQLAAYHRAEQAARDAADAAGAGDPVGFQQATQGLTDALAAASSGSDPLVGIEHACRPASGPAPLPRVPDGRVNA
jgi:hypothetical protein